MDATTPVFIILILTFVLLIAVFIGIVVVALLRARSNGENQTNKVALKASIKL